MHDRQENHTHDGAAEDAALAEKLSRALRAPQALPAGFADRLMQRASAQRPGAAKVRTPFWRGAVAAGLAILLASAGWHHHEQQQSRRSTALRAAGQFALAMHITQVTLENVGATVNGHLQEAAEANRRPL